LIYDTEGKLLQKIRKEYNPVPVTQSYKTEYVKLFVMTYEPGNNTGEFIYDVFNEDGIFFYRTSLKILHRNYGRLYAKANGREPSSLSLLVDIMRGRF